MPRKKKIPQHKKVLLIGGGVLLLLVAVYYMMKQTGDIVFARAVGSLFSNLWWIILPIPIWKVFYGVWAEYTHFTASFKKESVFLEIHPPQDLEKSPQIMEQVFIGLHTWATPNKFEEFCGWRAFQDTFAFEIVSTEGAVHFYANCPKVARNNMESQIYAQYPDAEIFEVEDYTKNVPKNLPNKHWDLWGTVFCLEKEDPVPIRTYKNFQEDVTGKMIDPLSSLTEVMGAIGKDQHIWLQIVFSPAHHGTWYPKCKAYMDKLTGKDDSGSSKSTGNPFFDFFQEIGFLFGNVFKGIFGAELSAPSEQETTEEKRDTFMMNALPPGEKDTIEAVNKNMSKTPFTTSMRFVYIGRREVLNKALGVAGPMGAIKQFADSNLNSLLPDNRTKTFANYYYIDPRLEWRKRRIMERYRSRSTTQGSFTFNTEELATVFHFPDMSVASQAFQRIEAKKADAPLDLPVEFESS
ncbi:MAG: hypothetical protein U9O20_00240 [Patescibacteria group bacterium]|nr:hypothetical protein [Patescibacteria group bacterium]